MVSTRAESKGGTERRRDTEREREAGFSERDSAGDELEMLMPALKRRFQACLDNDEVVLNYVGGQTMAEENKFAHNDKENADSNCSSFRQFERRHGTGRIAPKRPIAFGKLFERSKPLVSPPSGRFARSKNLVSPPPGSLCKNITTALKENVNKAEVHSQIVDDFWSTERQRKISAVARRKLTGVKTPIQSNSQPVEDKNIRHARSRRAGGNNRNVGRRPVKLDLDLDVAKISEWDQETLAVEEESGGVPSSRAFISAARPTWKGNSSALNQSRNARMQDAANGESGRGEEHQDEDGVHRVGGNPNHPLVAHENGQTPSSLPDMDLSPGETPHPNTLEQNVSSREEHSQHPLQDTGCRFPDRITKTARCKGDTFSAPVIHGDSLGVEAMEQRLLSPPPGLSQLPRENHGGHPQQIVNQGSQPVERTLGEDPPVTPCKGLPGPDRSSSQTPRSPVTSPTPPSNPVAVYMSLRRLEGDVGQRRLAFLSSPFSERLDTGRRRKGEKLDVEEVQSPTDLLCHSRGPQTTASADDLQGEKLGVEEVESRRDLCSGDADLKFSSKDDSDVLISPTSDQVNRSLNLQNYQGKKLYIDEVETLRDICNNGAHQMAASKGDEEGEQLDPQDVESWRDLCNSGTYQMAASGSVAEVEELQRSVKVSLTTPCDGGIHQMAASRDVAEVEKLQHSDKIPLTTPCNSRTPLKKNEIEEDRRDEVDSREGNLYHAVQHDNASRESLIFNSKACCSPGQGGNALLAISQNYPEDQDLEVPENSEDDNNLHAKSVGISQAEHTVCTRSAVNLEELNNEVATVIAEAGDTEAALPSGNGQQNIALDEGLIWKDEGSTTKTRPKKTRRNIIKAEERRFSLEDAGSTWKDGQRRSQRRRVRPMEWWRGEKLLYGRVHKSLTTIIGIKHSSPGKYARGIKDPFIVESYVPAKYSNLVRFAAI